ncbi:MAG: hypothetical protein SOT81_01825 [Treponema sp.]|nr:hypothetical protein [Treponema sp.]
MFNLAVIEPVEITESPRKNLHLKNHHIQYLGAFLPVRLPRPVKNRAIRSSAFASFLRFTSLRFGTPPARLLSLARPNQLPVTKIQI